MPELETVKIEVRYDRHPYCGWYVRDVATRERADFDSFSNAVAFAHWTSYDSYLRPLEPGDSCPFVNLIVYRKDGHVRSNTWLWPEGVKWNRYEVRQGAYRDDWFIYDSRGPHTAYCSKREAIAAARKLCRENQPATLRIRNKNGTWQEERTYPRFLDPKSKG